MSVDTQACPLCGKDNNCAVAAGKPPESCWCRHATITQDLLAQVPDELKMKSCICQACVEKHLNDKQDKQN